MRDTARLAATVIAALSWGVWLGGCRRALGAGLWLRGDTASLAVWLSSLVVAIVATVVALSLQRR